MPLEPEPPSCTATLWLSAWLNLSSAAYSPPIPTACRKLSKISKSNLSGAIRRVLRAPVTTLTMFIASLVLLAPGFAVAAEAVGHGGAPHLDGADLGLLWV